MKHLRMIFGCISVIIFISAINISCEKNKISRRLLETGNLSELPVTVNNTKYVNSREGLRVRTEPSLWGDKISLFPHRTKVSIIEVRPEIVIIDNISGNWELVEAGDIKGWVFGGYLSENPNDLFDMYIAGSYIDQGKVQACYWKNGERIPLPVPENAESSRAEKIIFSGDTMYIAGVHGGPYLWGFVPCYWKDGIRFDVTEISGWIYKQLHLSVNNTGDVYLSTRVEYEMSSGFTVWKNGVIIAEPSFGNPRNFGIDGFDIIDDDIYYTGISSNSTSSSATYWKNGDSKELSAPSRSWAFGINKFDERTYVLGAYYTDYNRDGIYFYVNCYWKDGMRTDLERKKYSSDDCTGISVIGDDVYCSGYDSMYVHENNGLYHKDIRACYWKNGKYTDIHPRGTKKSVAQGIASDKRDFILVGWYNSVNEEFEDEEGDQACYWINGNERIDLAGFHAYSICMK